MIEGSACPNYFRHKYFRLYGTPKFLFLNGAENRIMFYFELFLTSLLAVASLAGIINIFLSPRSLKIKLLLTSIIFAFAAALCIINLCVTVPDILLTQTYPTYTVDRKDHINLKLKPAILEYSQGYKELWLSLQNFSKNETYINPLIYIHFVDKMNIDSVNTTEKGWEKIEPNEDYRFNFDEDLHSGDGFHTDPILIKCDKPGDYRAIGTISVRDKQKLDIPFVIKINQPKSWNNNETRKGQ